MAGTLNDEILRATGGPTVNDGLRSYFTANGGVGGTLDVLERTWLLLQFPTAPVDSPIGDLWMRFPLPAGGAINDKKLRFWSLI